MGTDPYDSNSENRRYQAHLESFAPGNLVFGINLYNIISTCKTEVADFNLRRLQYESLRSLGWRHRDPTVSTMPH